MPVADVEVRASLETIIEETAQEGPTHALIGELARATLRLDEKCEARFDGIDARLDGIDARFDRMEARFDRVEGRLGLLEDNSRQMVAQLERLIGYIIRDELTAEPPPLSVG